MIRLGLRSRTLAPALALVCVVALGSGWWGFREVARRFASIERQDFQEHRRRAAQVVADRASDLEVKARDWARWDDAVNWLEGRYPKFPQTNLEDSTLSVLRQDALFYWWPDLRLAAGLSRTAGRFGYDTALEAALRHEVEAGRGDRSFLLHVGKTIHLVALVPVRPASGTPPDRGWFALCRRVDGGREDADLSRALQLPGRILVGGTGPGSVGGGDSVELEVRVPVLEGDSAILSLHVDRPLARLARETGRLFLRDFTFAVALAVALAILLLERGVIRRIVQLSHRVGRSRVGAERLDDGRRDEIGDLARSIDSLVARLEAARTEVEDALAESNAAVRARGQFLASMTHELRTPLNGVIGMTEMAMKGRLDPEQREALSLSRGAALALLETINGILEYSRLEKGAVELVTEDADLSSLAMDAVRILGPAADAKGVGLRVLCDPDLPRVLRFDPGRLRQILSNLAGNAVKFTTRGSVTVSVDLFGVSEGAAEVRIEVRDTGPGIPPARQKAIFEPFEQASPETAVRFGGTGLGLTIARDLVRAMGSSIELESEAGKGCRFGFLLRLPVVDPAPLHDGAPVPKIPVRLRLVDEEFAAHLAAWLDRLGVPCDGDDGVLVTDSAQRALADPGIAVVLVGPNGLRGARALLEGGRTRILTVPCPIRSILSALEKVSRPDPSIAVCATGLVLREVVRGMLEREGLRVVSAVDSEEAVRLAFEGCDLIVVDGDDPAWTDLDLAGRTVVRLGGAPRTGEFHVAKPVKAEELLAEVFRAAGTATSSVPKSASALDWSSGLE